MQRKNIVVIVAQNKQIKENNYSKMNFNFFKSLSKPILIISNAINLVF